MKNPVYTYQLTAGDGDDDNSSFSVYGDLLISAIGFDYETKNSYTTRIRSTDLAANFIERAFIITVSDTEEPAVPIVTGATPPDTVAIDRTAISENNAIGALVARLLTSDTDTFDVHTYHLVKGTGDDDNSSFSIFGDMLLAAEVFDFEKQNSFSLRVRSTDMGKGYYILELRGKQVYRSRIIVE